MCRWPTWPEQAQKHQIILPSSHHVATLIVEHYYVISGHSGKEHVLSLIRQKYWMVGARQLTRRVLRKCVVCRKCFAKPCEQRMADLPVDQLTPDKPPFCYVGVDFFGPILVKLGRSQIKSSLVWRSGQCTSKWRVPWMLAPSSPLYKDSCVVEVRWLRSDRTMARTSSEENGSFEKQFMSGIVKKFMNSCDKRRLCVDSIRLWLYIWEACGNDKFEQFTRFCLP